MECGREEWKFAGFSSPNFTAVPDEFFDVLAPRLNGGEVKALLYIIRRTFGFKKQRDTISINQMLHGIVKKNGERLDHGAGLSKPSLCRALNALTEKNVITATRQFDAQGGYLATCYELTMREGIAEGHPIKLETPLGKKTRQGGMSRNLTKPLVKKRDIQNTVDNKQGNDNVRGSKNEPRGTLLHRLPDQPRPKEHTDLIAGDILDALGDRHSQRFYLLVARKLPESLIRKTLSEIRAGKVDSPARVFTSQVLEFATKAQNREGSSSLTEARRKLVARFQSR